MSRLFFGVLGVCVTTASLGACAQVWGFDEGSLASGSADGDATDARPSDDGATPLPDGSTPPGDGATEDDGGSVLVPENCETRTIDELGYFVTEGGSDAPDCGAPNNPCATLQGALDAFRSGTTLKPHFHIATGTPHRESLVIPEAVMAAGATLEGAWFARKNGQNWQWATDCSRATEIASPGPRAITVERAADDESEPRTLTITNLQIGFAEDSEHAAGTSFYGVFVSHAALALKNVRIVVPAGRDGTPGNAGAAGAKGGDAQIGGDGAGDSANGGPGTHAPARTAVYRADGYTVEPVPAPEATRGTAGNNSPLVCTSHSLGGKGGEPGGAGQGGGGSLGVYAWGSSLSLSTTQILVTGGGQGGDGGKGGAGGDGGSSNVLGCNRKAGDGGDGGNGSAAPGGPAACVVRGDGSVVTGAEDQLTCTLGEGGAAGISPEQPAFDAAPGVAQAVLDLAIP